MKDDCHYYKVNTDRPTNYFENGPQNSNKGENEPDSSSIFSV